MIKNKLWIRLGLPVLILLAGACTHRAAPDAYGFIDARSWLVASPEAGQIVALDISEGLRVSQGVRAVQLDTLPLVLERKAVEAQMRALKPSIGSGMSFEKTYARTTMASLESQLEVLRARFSRYRVVNPEDGTVTALYAHLHEFVAPGQAIYRLSDLDALYVDAWLEGGLLSGLALGDEVEIKVDASGHSLKSLPGRVSFISSEAEFTPNKVMTRGTRTTQVYRVRIDVHNDGTLKAGMPVEVYLRPAL